MADDIPERLIAISRVSRRMERLTTDLDNELQKLCSTNSTKSENMKISLQGSAVGGGVFSRNASRGAYNFGQDTDFNVTISTLTRKEAEFLTPTRPGYYLLRNHEYFQKRIIDLFKYHPDFSKLAKTEYVNSRDVLANFCSILDSNYTNSLGQFFSQFNGSVHAKNFGISDGAEVANTTLMTMNIPAISKIFCHSWMTDAVPAVKLTFWPVEALGWISEGRWPSRDVREELKEKYGCYLVPKQSKQGANDWRLTFSDIENEILNMLFKNENCYLAYFLLKSLFYVFIHVIKCQCSVQKVHPFGSYIVKTILLNMSKYNPPESTLWNDTKAALKEMLTKLISGLKRGNIPHFIIPNLNILQSVVRDHDKDCKLLVRATKAVLFMRSDIDKHLGTLFAEHFAECDFTFDGLSSVNLLTEDMSTLFKDFISKLRDFWSNMSQWNEKIKVTCPKLVAEFTENAASYQQFSTFTLPAIIFSLLNQNETFTELLRSLNDNQAGDLTELLRSLNDDQAAELLRYLNDDQPDEFEEIDLD